MMATIIYTWQIVLNEECSQQWNFIVFSWLLDENSYQIIPVTTCYEELWLSLVFLASKEINNNTDKDNKG